MGPASDPLVARIAHEQDQARARAAVLRGRVAEIAAWLYQRGALRVILFGSLATGSEPHRSTDIDLCVEGLAETDRGEAALTFGASFDCGVDVVDWESASARLKRRVLADGIEMPRVSD
jgi:predicted nucleotidyltransferase